MIQTAVMIIAIAGTLFGLIKSLIAIKNDDANHYHRVHWIFIISSIVLAISGTNLIFKLCGIPGIMEGIYTIGMSIADAIKGRSVKKNEA